MKNIPRLDLSGFLLENTLRKGSLPQCIVEIQPKVYEGIATGKFLNELRS
jgi:hypothetical protein